MGGSSAAGLCALLQTHDAGKIEWSTDELRDMVRHQLDTPLCRGLGSRSAAAARELQRATPPADMQMTTSELFQHAHPPLELLKLVKSFAKLCRNDPTNPLPTELVMLMYYASITLALTKHDRRISSVSPAALERGLRWLMKQEWLDPQTSALLSAGLESVGGTPPAQPPAKPVGDGDKQETGELED